jgi:hypothetical protein
MAIQMAIVAAASGLGSAAAILSWLMDSKVRDALSAAL